MDKAVFILNQTQADCLGYHITWLPGLHWAVSIMPVAIHTNSHRKSDYIKYSEPNHSGKQLNRFCNDDPFINSWEMQVVLLQHFQGHCLILSTDQFVKKNQCYYQNNSII